MVHFAHFAGCFHLAEISGDATGSYGATGAPQAAPWGILGDLFCLVVWNMIYSDLWGFIVIYSGVMVEE